MAKLVEMDENTTVREQMEESVAPVILINKFKVEPDKLDAFLKAWAEDASYFKQQPGFISAQLHRGIGKSCVFINYAVWQSTEGYKRAFRNLDFSKLSDFPASTISPHLFKKVAVPGICGE
jgi:quinol monooxygenase YgiN